MLVNTAKRLSPLTLLGLAACGDSSVTMSSGVALKGPLDGARVYIDTNGDGSFTPDVDESVITGPDGKYSLENPNNLTVHMETTENTIDASSGANLTGLKFSGSATDEVLTPFTTMKIENPDLDLEALAKAMNLEGVDLTTFDPNADDVNSVDAIKYEKSAQQVASILQVAGSALASQAGEAVTEEAATSAVFDALTDKLKAAADADDILNLSDSDLISEVIQTAGSSEGVAIEEADLAPLKVKVVEQISGLNAAIGNVNSLESATFKASTDLADLYDNDANKALKTDAATILSNTAPTIDLANMAVDEVSDDEELPEGAILVGDLTITDNGSVASTELGGTDAASFMIGEDGKLYFIAGTDLDFEAKSTYSITITATDDLGETSEKSFTIELNDLNEYGYYEDAIVTGAPIVGQTISVSATVWDPDNVRDGHESNDFQNIQIEWFADGASVKVESDKLVEADEKYSLEITEAMVGKAITAKITYTDRAGNNEEFSPEAFGTVISSDTTATLTFYENPKEKGDAFIEAVEEIGNGMAAMEDRIGSSLDTFDQAIDAFYQSGAEEVLTVSSTGIKSVRGGATLEATFANFTPATLEELEAAVDGFDPDDTSTWIIDGGFSELKISGPDGDLITIAREADAWGSGDDARDTFYIVDNTAPDGAIKQIGFNGEFELQISTMLNFAESISETSDSAQDAANEEITSRLTQLGIEYTYNPDNSSYSFNLDDPDLSDEQKEALVEQIDEIFGTSNLTFSKSIIGGFDDWADDFDIDGFYVSDSNYDVKLSLNLEQTPTDPNENLMTFTVNDINTSIAVWGELPTTFANLLGVYDYFTYFHEFLDDDAETTMENLEAYDFGGVKGMGLYEFNSETNEWDPISKFEIPDFEAFITAGENGKIDDVIFAEDHQLEYTNADGQIESTVHDADGYYNVVGAGIDLDTLLGFFDVEETSATGI